jgi:hypothetical protein
MCRLSAIDMFYLEILTLEDGTDWSSQNVGMELPLYDAYSPRREQVSKLLQFQCALPSGE